MPTKRLLTSADISHLKHQAKDLLKAFRAKKLDALHRIREFHPKFFNATDANIFASSFGLSDAQLSIAREYGYSSWPRLRTVIAEASNQKPSLIHNDRIDDATFRYALDLLDEGNVTLLADHLAKHPGVVNQQVHFEGDNYFTDPTLIEFIAENPIRHGQLPDTIVEIARVILEAGAKENQTSLDATLTLVASGRIVRECSVQGALLDLLCDYGADPSSGLPAALAQGEFDAAKKLLARGAPNDLPTAAALDDQNTISKLAKTANKAQLQLGLALAALHNRAVIVTLLIAAGADPNRYCPAGGHSHCTPLHSAAWGGHLDTVKALIAGGARLDMGDIHHSATPLAWAEHAGQNEVATYLQSQPAR